MSTERGRKVLVQARVAAPSPRLHPWRSILFAPIGDGRRRRRGSDATRLIVAFLTVACAIEIVRANLHPEVTVQRVLGSPPDGVRWLVDVSWIFGSWGTVAIILGLAVAATCWHGARGWQGVRDVAASAALTLIVSGVLVLILGSAAGRPDVVSLHGYSRSFPVLHIAVAVAVATAALPYLARSVQRFIEFILALAVLATVVAGQGLPVNVLGSMAIGWGVTAAVHLAFGSPLGLPSREEVQALLGSIGLTPVEVSPTPYQTWGPAHYLADMGDHPPLSITFYGRDAAEAQFFSKLWRFVFYRSAGPMPAVTRIQQVEHEASITLLAAQAGARVPAVRTASTLGPSRDAVLITLAPAGNPLAEVDDPEISDLQLDDLFKQLLKLRDAAISHGALGPRTIRTAVNGGWLTMADFRLGTSGASRFLLDQDLAGAIATLALSVGVGRAVASVVRVVPTETLQGALAHLRRAGLDPSITFALGGKKDLLDQVRTEAATATHVEAPELVEPRRMSWKQVLVAVGTLVGGWALILVLINASHSVSTITKAQWGWVVVCALFCAASVLASAVSDVGSVPGVLPYGRTIGLEVADSFAVLAAGEASVAAAQIRFFQQQGYDTTTALTSGVVVNAASLLMKGALFLVAIPVAWRSFHFGKTLHQGNHSKALLLILAIILVVGLIVVVIAAVPKWRTVIFSKLRHHLSVVRADLKNVAKRPSKLAELFGGRLAAQLCLALALGSALHAFGAYLSVAALIIAITMAGVLASASPAGGGMGVAEAGLILALTAGGIGKQTATAAVFVDRLFSAYIPPIIGWFTFMWMRKREYL
jgi:glycosyltransferase 2 family protein